MQYRRLGKTELNVSVVGLGTWQFGGEWGKTFTQQEVDAVLSTAQDCGVNFIDTAECYGNHLSESLIGRSIKKERNQWIVATKFGHVFHDFMDRSPSYSVNEVRQQLEDSLAALRTDRIDLYQLHSGPDDIFDKGDLWEMLQKQKAAGKILHLGISISPNKNIYQVENGLRVGAETIQVVYNRLDPEAETEVLPSCAVHDLGVLARVPLASGFLSGKYAAGARFTSNDVRSRQDEKTITDKLKRIEELRKNEVPPDIPLGQWALAWCLANPAVSAVIPGCKNQEQVKANAAAADLDISKPFRGWPVTNQKPDSIKKTNPHQKRKKE